MSAQAQAQKTIAFVLYPGLTPLDLIGPLQVMSALPLIDPSFRTKVVGERMDSVPSDTPIRLTPDGVFDDELDPFAVVVPGGGAPTIRALANEAILDYVRAAAQSAEFVTSVCTGALVLAAAGLLEGRHATTHWAYAGMLDGWAPSTSESGGSRTASKSRPQVYPRGSTWRFTSLNA